ncbi:MAG: potassium channel family protein [Duncaniella sp.]|nr:potassium channel family protein [Duncaniella sp.]MDE5915895.1 potassium channel family protein [Duncaniella sp.]
MIDILRWIIIILSILLIVFISVDTFTGVNFLESRRYMTFQFWVCIIFMADFFIELTLSANRWSYVRSHFLYFLLSIPYLNLIDILQIHLTPEQLFFVRFIPLARGVMAMTIVVGAISENKLTSFLMSYIVSLASFIYLGSLLFYYCESGVNTAVTNFGLALWWACMNATTLGCDIYPVTVTGKILGCILSVGGIIMFPLFTVYITALIRQYTKTHKILSAINSHRTQKNSNFADQSDISQDEMHNASQHN